MRSVVLCAFILFELAENVPLKVHFPPSSSRNYPRLRLNQQFPTLKEFTACSWIKPHAIQKEFSTFFSYATSRSNNELALCLSNHNGNIKVGVNVATGYIEATCRGLNWRVGEWYHVCASWFGSDGRLRVYTNGQRCYNNTYSDIISVGDHVVGGGVFVFGQDQDDLDSKYEAHQSWIGDIADINIWDEVLTDNQIVEAGKCGGKRKTGNVIAGLSTAMTALGVTISLTELCLP